MENVKRKLEDRFKKLAYFSYDHSTKIIPLFVVTIFLLAINLVNIQFDLDISSFIPPDNPKRVQEDAFKDQFGRDDRAIIAIKTDDVYDPEFLNRLHQLQQEIEQIPYVKEVDSLINARKTTGNEEELIVDDLFLNFPIRSEDAVKAKQYIDQTGFNKNLFIDESETIATLVITSYTYLEELATASTGISSGDDDLDEFEDLTGVDSTLDPAEDITRTPLDYKQEGELVDGIYAVLEEYPDWEIYVAGGTLLAESLRSSLIGNMLVFVALAIMVILLVLFTVFRRKEGVVMPMIVVGLSSLTTISIIVATGSPMTTFASIVPSFILSIGIGDSIHILSIFYSRYDETGDRRESIAYALSHSGLAVFMTSFTTVASLLSFALSPLPPIAQLGQFTALGATIALIYTLVLLPAIISKFPMKPRPHQEIHQKWERFLTSVATFTSKWARTIVATSGLLIVVSGYFASQLKYTHNPIDWLNDEDPFKVSTRMIDQNLKGSSVLEIVIDTQKENGLYDPKLLKAMESASQEIGQLKGEGYFVGKVVGLPDLLKEINLALHGNDMDYYRVPERRDLVAQELFLFENTGSDDLETLVDRQFSKTHITVKVPWIEASHYIPFLKDVNSIIDKHFDSVKDVHTTGFIDMMVETVDITIRSTIKSYFISYLFIAVLMILLLWHFKLGMLAMIPNVLPVLVGLATMHLFDLDLDLFTILIGAIAIGLCVDDTIHFLSNFQRYYHQSGDVNQAMRKTFIGTGRAMCVTTLVLLLGFSVYAFADMSNIATFGKITALVILWALLCDLLLMPAMLKWYYYKKNK